MLLYKQAVFLPFHLHRISAYLKWLDYIKSSLKENVKMWIKIIYLESTSIYTIDSEIINL